MFSDYDSNSLQQYITTHYEDGKINGSYSTDFSYRLSVSFKYVYGSRPSVPFMSTNSTTGRELYVPLVKSFN